LLFLFASDGEEKIQRIRMGEFFQFQLVISLAWMNWSRATAMIHHPESKSIDGIVVGLSVFCCLLAGHIRRSQEEKWKVRKRK